MDGIRVALLEKFGVVPLLDTYRQMAVRQQKAKNWPEALRWARRGLTLYGSNAARPEAVDDLQKRVAAYSAKVSRSSDPHPAAAKVVERSSGAVLETLTCAKCGVDFERAITRGRKPRTCPACR
jgi:predicted Zn-ribbon and HTH transcriptional regulator